jgi:hypothetical protein
VATTGHIALFGEFLHGRLNLNAGAREFSWSTRHAKIVSNLKAVGTRTPLLAVLIHPRSLDMSWSDALNLTRAAVPEIRVVICHEMDELDSQPEMIASGAFYTLLMPADSRELRFLFSELGRSLMDSHALRKVQDGPCLGVLVAGAA